LSSSKQSIMTKIQTWEAALDRLKTGNKNFVQDQLDGMLENSSRRKELVSGQAPYAIILSCADSRVVPELAFDTGLGELFVIRVAGNVANASSLASIEYAVANLGVKLIVVMGHESCGAVTAAVAGGDNGPNLNHLLDYITPAVKACPDSDVNTIVRKNAVLTSEQMLADSTIIRQAVEENDVKILPAYYNFENGQVDFL
jgi:carbonic anhydrase